MRHDHDGLSVSPWMATNDVPTFAPLFDDLDADVVVVGAGIAGLSTAYLLACEGRSVVVLDDGSIGGGQTKRTTAHLSSAIDDRFVRLERLHGAETTRLAWQSHAAAIDRIDAIVRAENIECGFARLDGFLCLGAGQERSVIDEEFDAVRRAGYASVELLEHSPIAGLEGPCLRFPDQAQFDPLRYLTGLAEAALARGVDIFTGSHVVAIDPVMALPRLRVRVESGATVAANWAVVATNSPIHTRFAMHTKQTAYRTYAIALSAPRGSVRPALYWDTLDPYHYVRVHAEPDAGEELVIVGGEDHRIGATSFEEADDRYFRLEEWARARFPGLGGREYEWSGQVMEPVDGLAFIGRSPGGGPEGVLLATGDSGMGLTHGTIAGMLFTDLIEGRENPWERIYDPSRKSLRAAAEFARENATSAAHYLDWLKTTPDVEAIEPGSGAVVRHGVQMLAVYREDDGRLTVCTAVCPHLGGIVGWNESERTWDCPLHGSRFDRYGRVVQGPANGDLEAAELGVAKDLDVVKAGPEG
jgi:glycine/D-amino acid oxidase-like deaminating enzyme/nitrite reductase/ring-hydroxylating ferredoxin subunit